MEIFSTIYHNGKDMCRNDRIIFFFHINFCMVIFYELSYNFLYGIVVSIYVRKIIYFDRNLSKVSLYHNQFLLTISHTYTLLKLSNSIYTRHNDKIFHIYVHMPLSSHIDFRIQGLMFHKL